MKYCGKFAHLNNITYANRTCLLPRGVAVMQIMRCIPPPNSSSSFEVSTIFWDGNLEDIFLSKCYVSVVLPLEILLLSLWSAQCYIMSSVCVAVVWDDFVYVLTVSSHKIYAVKKRYVSAEA